MGTICPHLSNNIGNEFWRYMPNIFLPRTVVTPGALLIAAISNTNPMVITITDSEENTYIVGQLVCLTVPDSYGMFQANELTTQITNITGLNFTVNVDATKFDTFAIPGAGVTISRPASLSPAGSRNLQFDNSTNNVPFKSLNNIGN